jgi:hypothetical protein
MDSMLLWALVEKKWKGKVKKKQPKKSHKSTVPLKSHKSTVPLKSHVLRLAVVLFQQPLSTDYMYLTRATARRCFIPTATLDWLRVSHTCYGSPLSAYSSHSRLTTCISHVLRLAVVCLQQPLSTDYMYLTRATARRCLITAATLDWLHVSQTWRPLVLEGTWFESVQRTSNPDRCFIIFEAFKTSRPLPHPNFIISHCHHCISFDSSNIFSWYGGKVVLVFSTTSLRYRGVVWR